MGNESIVLLDTHVWFWHLMEGHLLSVHAKKAIKSSSTLLVSAISCLEIANLVKKNRVSLSVDLKQWMTEALKEDRIALVHLMPNISVLSTQLPGEFHKDPADQILAATAITYSCPLITKDKNLQNYPHIKTIW